MGNVVKRTGAKKEKEIDTTCKVGTAGWVKKFPTKKITVSFVVYFGSHLVQRFAVYVSYNCCPLKSPFSSQKAVAIIFQLVYGNLNFSISFKLGVATVLIVVLFLYDVDSLLSPVTL